MRLVLPDKEHKKLMKLGCGYTTQYVYTSLVWTDVACSSFLLS